MENNNGVVISTLTTGATLKEFLVPTETGALKNIVLGFSDFEDYYKNNLCACQSIGRVAGRIGKAGRRSPRPSRSVRIVCAPQATSPGPF